MKRLTEEINSRMSRNRSLRNPVLIICGILVLFQFYLRYLVQQSSFAGLQFQPVQRTSVAVIGAGGYIGSRLLDELNRRGFVVTGFDRDTTPLSTNKLDSFIRFTAASEIPTATLQTFKTIVYLGGYTGRAVCDQFPQDVHKENVDDVVHLARRMRSSQLLIFASTSAILEGTGFLPGAEDHSVKESLLDNYSMSMYNREQMLREQSNSNSPRMVGLRFGTVIGHSYSQRQEMAYLSFIKSAFTTGKLEVRHPETSRSWLWMTDLVRAIFAIENSRNKFGSFEIFHLSSFDASVGAIALEIVSLTGASVNHRQHDGPDVKGFSLNVSKFSNKFNFVFRGTARTIAEELVLHAPQVVIGRDKPDSPRLRVKPLEGLCGVCGNTDGYDIMKVLDLGMQPLANDFKVDVDDSLRTGRFPLCLVRCRTCHHVQLSHIVDRPTLFSNYLYRSNTTETLKDHFIRLAYKIDAAVPKPVGRPKRILEIACNDGSQLNQFKSLGWQTFGADPAANIVELARAEGHAVKVGFWGVDDFSDMLPSDLDIIVAQNVLAHVPDPVKFLQACAKHMTQHTRLYIQTSQCDMFESGQFDTIYHEHIHFFTAHSFKRLAELTHMDIVDFEIVSIHGRSCLVTFTKKNAGEVGVASYSMTNRLAYEQSLGATSDFYYAKFKSRANSVQLWIHEQLNRLSVDGFQVVGYGAAAKGIVVLHSLLVLPHRTYKFESIIDDEPMKQGRYCPGTSIPVRPSSSLSQIRKPLVIVVFAWNFEAEIGKKVAKLLEHSSQSVKLLIPFPEQRLFELDVSAGTRRLSGKNKYAPRPWPLPFRVGRREVVLYSHVYNEELMIPYWIRHHAPMFDRAYIFDYSSTDKTVELLRELAPSTWVIQSSRNTKFGAVEVDDEIMVAESMCDDCWKIALTATEFLFHENLRDFLAQQDNIIDAPPRYFSIPMFMMVDDGQGAPLKPYESLISQRSTLLPKSDASRYLHNFFSSEYRYSAGRHGFGGVIPSTATFEPMTSAAIFKFRFAPWPEVKARISQIGYRMPESDVVAQLGIHHTKLKNASYVVSEYERLKSLELIDLFNASHCYNSNSECLPYNCLTCQVHRAVVSVEGA